MQISLWLILVADAIDVSLRDPTPSISRADSWYTLALLMDFCVVVAVQ